MTDPSRSAARRARTQAMDAGLLAHPSVTEADIAAAGIHTVAGLDAAMSRSPKGPVLLRALIGALTTGQDWPAEARQQRIRLLTTLLSEHPELPLEYLRATRPALALWASPGYAGFVTALATHPGADAALVVNAVWGASSDVATAVARTRGDLLSVAACWIRAKTARKVFSDKATAAQVGVAAATAATWAAWAGTDPDRRAFLINCWDEFADQDTMLAAGAAMCAPPAGPAASHS